MPFRHLPGAPITEAVLDVRVRSRPELAVADFKSVHRRILPEYPRMDERRNVTARVKIAEAMNVEPSVTVNGYLFRSEDGLDVAQFRTDGFSINRLRPYTGWDAFFARFERLWPLYLEVAQPRAVTRVAARCINHIPTETEGSLADYFTAPVNIPEGLPSVLKTFSSTMLLAVDRRESEFINLVQALQIAPDGHAPQFLVDIDAFMVGEFESASVPSLFDRLHELRNAAFFKTLTPQLIQRFE